MGLFGFIISIIGFGAMAKDSISDSISDSINIEKAQQDGREFYSVNGYKTRSTKTGRDASFKYDPITKHQTLIDSKTREVIEDFTVNNNIKKTEENRRKSIEKGWKFYRTAMFDCSPLYWSDVWVNDDMPGKYFHKIDSMNNGITFYEGTLKNCFSRGQKEVSYSFANNEYKPNGTLIIHNNGR